MHLYQCHLKQLAVCGSLGVSRLRIARSFSKIPSGFVQCIKQSGKEKLKSAPNPILKCRMSLIKDDQASDQ